MGYIPLICKDCNVEIFVDMNMVMLKDELWSNICDNHEDSYCDKCIEARMGRPIEISDFRPMTGPDITGAGHIPCNAWWLEEKLKSIKK